MDAGSLRAYLGTRYVRLCALVLALTAAAVLLIFGPPAGATVVPHAVTANPTCSSAVGFKGDHLIGCAQATPTGLTFTWTGYTDYSSAVQFVGVNVGGTPIAENVTCTLPTCTKSVPLGNGEYTGSFTVVTGSGPNVQIPFDLVVSPSAPPLPPPISSPVAGIASTPDGAGYWIAGTNGDVYAFGDAVSYGSRAGMPLNKPIVGIASTSDGKGYWLLGGDGGIFAFGDAQFYGSTGNLVLNKPVVGIAATPDGKGYWLVASDGGVFSFGDAQFSGSAGNIPLQKPVVGMAVDQATGGYWLVASDGGIFSFNAPFYGSTGATPLVQPIVGMAAAANGGGYRLVAKDGGVFDFNQPFAGSLGGEALPAPIVGMAANNAGGYWVVGATATVSGFGGAPVYPVRN
jgi:hypothetical protein